VFYVLSQKAGPIRDVISSGIDNKCHWWSGYDLLRRLLFFVVYLIFENFNSDYTQVILCVIKADRIWLKISVVCHYFAATITDFEVEFQFFLIMGKILDPYKTCDNSEF